MDDPGDEVALVTPCHAPSLAKLVELGGGECSVQHSVVADAQPLPRLPAGDPLNVGILGRRDRLEDSTELADDALPVTLAEAPQVLLRAAGELDVIDSHPGVTLARPIR